MDIVCPTVSHGGGDYRGMWSTLICLGFFSSSLSYQLVEADLLVCMPLDGRIKTENDEFDKASRAYMLAIPTSSRKSPNVKSTPKNNDGIKT